MNQIDQNPDYKKMYRFVRTEFSKTKYFGNGPFDETYFTMRVYESAKEIISKLNSKVNVQQVLTAGILHDIGKIKLDNSKLFNKERVLETCSAEWKTHTALSVPIAKQFLEKAGHSEEFIEAVCQLIEKHSLRGDLLPHRSLELQIMQDADLLADIGFAGFIRPFLYSGKFNRSIIETIKFIQHEDGTEKGSLLNLAVSKTLAEEKMKIQQRLASEVARELNSDLL